MILFEIPWVLILVLILFGMVAAHGMILSLSNFLINWGWIILVLMLILVIGFNLAAFDCKSKKEKIILNISWGIADFIRIFGIFVVFMTLAWHTVAVGNNFFLIIDEIIGVVILGGIMGMLIAVSTLATMKRDDMFFYGTYINALLVIADLLLAVIFIIACRGLIIGLFPTIFERYISGTIYGDLMFIN